MLRLMTQETITIIGVGVALAAVILPGQWAMRREIADLRKNMAALSDRMTGFAERMTRLEGLFDGFTKREAGD